MALKNGARRVHRHASHVREGGRPGCLTVCGLDCDSVDTAYAHDSERVSCSECLNDEPLGAGSVFPATEGGIPYKR